MLGVFRFALKWSMTFPWFHCVIRDYVRRTISQGMPEKNTWMPFISNETNFGNSDSSILLLSPDKSISSSFWQWLYNTKCICWYRLAFSLCPWEHNKITPTTCLWFWIIIIILTSYEQQDEGVLLKQYLIGCTVCFISRC